MNRIKIVTNSNLGNLQDMVNDNLIEITSKNWVVVKDVDFHIDGDYYIAIIKYKI